MDKKHISRHGSNKILSTDSRRIPGVLPNKNSLRNSRREISTHTKKESQRSNKISSKLRQNVDKRPKARIGLDCNQSETISLPSTGLNDLETHLDAITPIHRNFESAGSRKSNLNHLLNFNYNRNDYQHQTCKRNVMHARKHKYNKEQFLQANFQFVVNRKAKAAIMSSPGTLVDWEFIEQINVQTTEELLCPICLCPPMAAKLTRCGHAYCWTCILHYLALTDKAWRKCPICYEVVYSDDLKSMTVVQQKKITVGKYIDLQLMRRMKGSLFVQQCGCSYPSENLLSVTDDTAKFAKFLLARTTDILSIIERENEELQNVTCDDNGVEFVFIQQALKLLKVRKTLTYKGVESDIDIMPNQINLNQSDLNIGKNEIKKNSSISRIENQGVKYYYFYQSIDGQQIFLHPLNIKMLQACFGSLDRAPFHIHARVVQKEQYSMDDDNRKKFTCLAHLPHTCHFEIVEVELKSPTVTEEIIRLFEESILQRKKNRIKKHREEKKREVRINEIFDKQMGKIIVSTASINLSSSHEFPMCGSEETLLNQSCFTNNMCYTDNIGALANSSPTNRNSYSSVINSICSSEINSWPSLGEIKPLMLKQPNIKKEHVVQLSTRNACASSVMHDFATDIQAISHSDNFLPTDVDQKYKYVKKENPNDNKKSRKSKNTLLFSTGMNLNVK